MLKRAFAPNLRSIRQGNEGGRRSRSIRDNAALREMVIYISWVIDRGADSLLTGGILSGERGMEREDEDPIQTGPEV